MSQDFIQKRDRVIVLIGIVALALLSWTYILYLSRDTNNMATMDDTSGMDNMTNMDNMDMEMPQMHTWGAAEFMVTFLMWAVMMTAMMVPTAAPMILLFANVQRKRKAEQRPYVPTIFFVLGYLGVWYGFAAAASLIQGGLHTAALLSPEMVATSPVLGGVLLVAAGIFQWSPLKAVCLSHCRSPLGFLMTEWREGIKGAFVMGLRHGIFCLGCCWVLMTLLFVLGVMNLLWIAALAVFVLIEKIAPAGQWVGRVTGILLVGWGAWIILGMLV